EISLLMQVDLQWLGQPPAHRNGTRLHFACRFPPDANLDDVAGGRVHAFQRGGPRLARQRSSGVTRTGKPLYWPPEGRDPGPLRAAHEALLIIPTGAPFRILRTRDGRIIR